MLLQRLAQYTHDTATEQIPFYAEKAVRWLLDLNADGSPASTELTMLSGIGKSAARGAVQQVPSVTKTSGIAPAIGTDTLEYVLGWVSQDPKAGSNPERVQACHEAFIALNEAWSASDPKGPAATIAAFYRSGAAGQIALPDAWARGDLVDIVIDGQRAVETPSAHAFWAEVASARKGSGRRGLCLVCGRGGELLNTIPRQLPARLVPGATQSSSLISVNKPTHGFQLVTGLTHTPICDRCGLKVMDSLEALLGDGDHSAYSGDSRMAWWLPNGGDFEPGLYTHPGEHLDRIHGLVAAAHQGWTHPLEETTQETLERFCAVTIGGNVSRIMIRDWIDMPLAELKHNLGRWFTDIAVPIKDGPAYSGIGRLALACGRYTADQPTANDGSPRGGYMRFDAKGADRPDDVYRGLLEAALYGRRLPAGLARHLLHRIRRDGHIDDPRAALLRLCLRRADPRHRSEDHMSIDDTTTASPGFIAGRIFATYEYLQWASGNPRKTKGDGTGERGEVNTTFKHKYFAGGMSNPQRALLAGARLSTAWLRVLERHNPALGTWIRNHLGALHDEILTAGGIPRTATATQQTQFVLGYYHESNSRRRGGGTTASDEGETQEGTQE